MTQRVSKPTADDLYLAADWLDTYDGGDDDPNEAACKRVAEWLAAQADALVFDQQAREIAVQAGRDPKDPATMRVVRKALRAAMAEKKETGR